MKAFYKVFHRDAPELFHICYEGSRDMYSKNRREALVHAVMSSAFYADIIAGAEKLSIDEVDEEYVRSLGLWKGSFYKNMERRRG